MAKAFREDNAKHNAKVYKCYQALAQVAKEMHEG